MDNMIKGSNTKVIAATHEFTKETIAVFNIAFIASHTCK
jgi:hypothetical protein